MADAATASKTKRTSTKAGPRQQEFDQKIARIRAYLQANGMGGVALSSQSLFAWGTAGGDNHVVLASEHGVGHLVVTLERVAVVANNIEIERLRTEEFNGIDTGAIEFWHCPWYQGELLAKDIHRRMEGRRWASDAGLPGAEKINEPFVSLTYALTPQEITRYRALGKDCSLAMEEALADVRAGAAEYEIAGLIHARLLDRIVKPHVILVAADERVFKHRHPIPTGRKVKKHLMAVLCGKRGGLIVALTRMLHFGRKLPDELARKHEAVCHVDVALNAATRPGVAAKDILAAGIDEYRRWGFGDEWKLHHQGGPCGYQGRSFLGTPTEERTALSNEAFAWNPSITGTKSEDTILVTEKGFEFLSGPSKKWPVQKVKYNGRQVARAAIRLK